MFFSFLTRLLIMTAVTGSYALAADLPDINGAILTPPAEQFSRMPSASDAQAQPSASGMPSSEMAATETQPSVAETPDAAPSVTISDAPSPPAPAEGEGIKQDQVITTVLQAIRQHKLTPLASDCLSMSFVDDSDDPANYLIDVRENRHNPSCGGDPETAPHLFFFKASKKDGALQTDAGVEPDDFYPLENSEQPAIAALTAADFVIQVNSTTLALGQPWNEDVMMSLPPERTQQAQNPAPDAEVPYRYYQHRYDVLALTVSNEGWDRQQRSADDNYLGQITLLDATLETHRGARVGMTVAELEQKYGPGEAAERNGESWLIWQQDEKVISARIGNGLVTQITLSQLQHAADAQG